MNELKPVDIFQQGVQRFYEYLEPQGWKLLKANCIKKRSGALTYEINFMSSHHNYIDTINRDGYVLLGIFGFVMLNKEIVLHFSFTKPMDYAVRFQICTDKLSLDKRLIDNLYILIKENFLSVIEGFEVDPVRQVRDLGARYEIHADDYSWLIILDRKLVQYIGDEKLVLEYDANCCEYSRIENVLRRRQNEFMASALIYADFSWCGADHHEWLSDILERSYNYLLLKNGDENHRLKYELVREIEPHEFNKFAHGVYGFCLLIIDNVAVDNKELADEIYKLKGLLYGKKKDSDQSSLIHKQKSFRKLFEKWF